MTDRRNKQTDRWQIAEGNMGDRLTIAQTYKHETFNNRIWKYFPSHTQYLALKLLSKEWLSEGKTFAKLTFAKMLQHLMKHLGVIRKGGSYLIGSPRLTLINSLSPMSRVRAMDTSSHCSSMSSLAWDCHGTTDIKVTLPLSTYM